MKNHLYLVRGLPGSGKSTFSAKLLKSGVAQRHNEADQFMYENGVYKFDYKKLALCHEECLSWTKYHLDEGYDTVVSNTFTTLREMDPYISLGYPFTIILCEGNYGSIHNVPQRTIDKMRERFEYV